MSLPKSTPLTRKLKRIGTWKVLTGLRFQWGLMTLSKQTLQRHKPCDLTWQIERMILPIHQACTITCCTLLSAIKWVRTMIQRHPVAQAWPMLQCVWHTFLWEPNSCSSCSYNSGTALQHMEQKESCAVSWH